MKFIFMWFKIIVFQELRKILKQFQTMMILIFTFPLLLIQEIKHIYTKKRLF